MDFMLRRCGLLRPGAWLGAVPSVFEVMVRPSREADAVSVQMVSDICAVGFGLRQSLQ